VCIDVLRDSVSVLAHLNFLILALVEKTVESF
jgi:hypothetical protein